MTPILNFTSGLLTGVSGSSTSGSDTGARQYSFIDGICVGVSEIIPGVMKNTQNFTFIDGILVGVSGSISGSTSGSGGGGGGSGSIVGNMSADHLGIYAESNRYYANYSTFPYPHWTEYIAGTGINTSGSNTFTTRYFNGDVVADRETTTYNSIRDYIICVAHAPEEGYWTIQWDIEIVNPGDVSYADSGHNVHDGSVMIEDLQQADSNAFSEDGNYLSGGGIYGQYYGTYTNPVPHSQILSSRSLIGGYWQHSFIGNVNQYIGIGIFSSDRRADIQYIIHGVYGTKV